MFESNNIELIPGDRFVQKVDSEVQKSSANIRDKSKVFSFYRKVFLSLKGSSYNLICLRWVLEAVLSAWVNTDDLWVKRHERQFLSKVVSWK